MTARDGAGAMDLQRQMVLELLGDVTGEISEKMDLSEQNLNTSHSDDKSNEKSDSEIDSENEAPVETKKKTDTCENNSEEFLQDMLRRAKEFTKSKSSPIENMEIDKNNYSDENNENYNNSKHSLDFSKPKMLCELSEYFEGCDNFTKGCHWSPDGDYLLTLGNDQSFRMFNINQQACEASVESNNQENIYEVESPAIMKEGELVYDYQWYPLMNSDDPSSCYFATASRGLPVHLWNTQTKSVAYSYLPINHLDEIAPAYSLRFSRDGYFLICGFKKCIRYFHTERPGRQSTYICAKSQRGVISCFDFHPHLHHLFAAGCYQGNIGLYNTNTDRVFSILNGQNGGITQVLFSEDGYKLYSGARKDNEIICWDIRNLGTVFSVYERPVDTNQRISFTLSPDQSTLISGSTKGQVLAYDLSTTPTGESLLKPTHKLETNSLCVNGVSVHPNLSILAASTGRRFSNPTPENSSEEEGNNSSPQDLNWNTVQIWKL